MMCMHILGTMNRIVYLAQSYCVQWRIQESDDVYAHFRDHE